jgi:hypothetical protein
VLRASLRHDVRGDRRVFAPRLRAEQSPKEQKEAVLTSIYYMPYMTINDLITSFARYNQMIREVARTHQTLLVGGEETIPTDCKQYTDPVHFTDAGSVVMAHRAGEVLLSSAALQALVERKTVQIKNP